MWFVFAAASSLCFGLRGILYQWTAQRPINRDLLLFGVFLSGALIALSASLMTGQAWTKPVWIGVLMGLFSFLANGAVYKGFAVGKTSLVAMFTGLPPVVVVLLAYLLWGEKLNGWQSISFLIILAGIVLIRYSSDLSLNNLQGAQWGALAMLFFGLNDLAGKQSTLLDAASLPTLSLMFATGASLSGIIWLVRLKRNADTAHLRAAQETAASAEKAVGAAAASNTAAAQWPPGKTLLWGLVVGITNVIGMTLLMQAFKLGVTGLVSAVVSMSVAFVLLYARFVLKEKFSRLEAGGLLCAFIGIILLRLSA
ncbi:MULTISPECIES: EamA family transporter [unclassified Paenibacillus]|uniref:EamA family transporter n=1 Tax=unclassified Paenibacillus TaxID=185978 RepID=UPI001AE62AA0|nr:MULTISPECIES: EamA family transporter [unclassified Paenibacillus]MBP1154811.1 drug/metabolite transporter (DMT)-like permease [Paenibacillus sp. PvP091]MBP1169805.1 drug/metabolite transporter (DMT)-like permease [Paenibacillus sp. PvR098]MBP2440833.1 drug/metabolite transporter (DMT)-like permease [Paenibacillus sp. PvP052]